MEFYCLPATWPFILNLESGTMSDCESRIRWQNDHQADWRIVSKCDEECRFKCVKTGEVFKIDKPSPYRAEVWEKFLEKLWPNR